MDINLIITIGIMVVVLFIVVIIFIWKIQSKSIEDKDKILQQLMEEKEKEQKILIDENKRLLDKAEEDKKIIKEQNDKELSFIKKQLTEIKQEKNSSDIKVEEKISQLSQFKQIGLDMDSKFKQLKPMTDFLTQFRSGSSGKHGEFILENIVESYGFRYCEDFNPKNIDPGTYITQTKIDGDNIPDLVLFLEKDKYIVIDSKTIQFDFNNKLSKTDIEKKLDSHIKNLSSKEYELMEIDNKIGLDLVILFVPNDELLKFVDFNTKKSDKIIIATTSTLIPIISVLKSIVKTSEIANVSIISNELKNIYASLSKSLNHFYNSKSDLESLLSNMNKLDEELKNMDNIPDTLDKLQQIISFEPKRTETLNRDTLKQLK